MEARTFTETYVEAPDEETTPLQPDGTSTNGDGQQHATSNVLPDFSRQDNRPTFFFMTPSNDVYLDVHLQYAFDHHHLPQAPINIRVIHDDRELLVNTLAALEPHIYIFRPKTEVKRLDRLNSMKVSSFKGKLTGKVGGLIIGTPLGMIAGAAVGAILGGSVVRNRAVSTFGSIGGSYFGSSAGARYGQAVVSAIGAGTGAVIGAATGVAREWYYFEVTLDVERMMAQNYRIAQIGPDFGHTL